MEGGMNGNEKTIHNYSEYFSATLRRSLQHSDHLLILTLILKRKRISKKWLISCSGQKKNLFLIN